MTNITGYVTTLIIVRTMGIYPEPIIGDKNITALSEVAIFTIEIILSLKHHGCSSSFQLSSKKFNVTYPMKLQRAFTTSVLIIMKF
jgi:hypothetical protein